MNDLTLEVDMATIVQGSYFTVQSNKSEGYTVIDRLPMTSAYQHESFPIFTGLCAMNGYILAYIDKDI